MKSGSYTFSQAQSQCPSGYSVATNAQLETLVSKYSGGGLYAALGLSSNDAFWSSTAIDTTLAYALYVASSDLGVYPFNIWHTPGGGAGVVYYTYGVACVK